MVKRRKGNSGQSLREAKDDRPSRSAVDDVAAARSRLRGALLLLLDPSETSTNDDPHKQGFKRKQDDVLSNLKQEQMLARQEEKKAAIAARRKQRRAEMSQVAYHNTFVMKLFDRSVDLAQFKEDTPLYPICRAWMANQPRGVPFKIKRSPSPETKPKPEPLDDDEEVANGSGSRMDVDSAEESEVDLVRETYSLPPPAPLTFLRHPLSKPDEISSLDLILNEDSDAPSKEELLKEHVSKWTDVRNEWIKVANENEDRYKQSKKILKAIYEKAQKAFE